MGKSFKFSCLIIDDEMLARQLIQIHIKQIPQLTLLGTYSSAIDAIEYLNNNKVDILFLDIEMPQLNGIDFLKNLHNPPKVVFTTAYSEFALDGYELNIVDYLLKPITFDRFNRAALKCIEILNLERELHELSHVELKEKSIVIKSSHQLIKINTSDILYIEGLHKYIKIVTKDSIQKTLFSLTAIQNQLPTNSFYRCHRSFIVNINEVNKIEGLFAFIGIHKIAISKLNKTEFKDKLGQLIN